MTPDRDGHRVYFANTPAWIPLGIVCLVIVGAIAAMLVRDAPAGPGPQVDQLANDVAAHRDGGDVIAALGDARHVTDHPDRDVVVVAVVGDDGVCHGVYVDAPTLADADGSTALAGPLPLDDRFCPQGS